MSYTRQVPRFALAALALFAAGCGDQRPPLDAAIQGRAVASIANTFGAPNQIHLQQAWLAIHGATMRLVCGRIDPPALLEPRPPALRFVYDDEHRNGQVEYHNMIVADTVGGGALIAENRRLFDNLWNTECAPIDPSRSWLESITG